jgi:hypothetical protein
MHKAFFSCALALPHLTAATHDEPDYVPLLACQIGEGFTLAEPT